MTKEEKLIKHLKKRRPRIIAVAVLIITTSAFLGFGIHYSMEFDALITPERVSQMATFENPKVELPELFCKFHALAAGKAKMVFYSMFFSCAIGALIGILIIDIFNLGQRRLIISMWERIQKLEQESTDNREKGA